MKNKPHHYNSPLSELGKQSGFTLTELLVVIALIALIGTFVTSQVISKFNRAKVDATKINMRQLGNVLEQFYLNCNRYPTTEQGLEALLQKPPGLDCENYDPEGYLKASKIPKDGFGKDFNYESNGKEYEIKSLGTDGKPGGEGVDADISSKEID